MTLPHEVVLSSKGPSSEQKYRLPPSFVEKHTTISIQYHIGVNLRRGKFRPNDQYALWPYLSVSNCKINSCHRRLRTSLAYIPSLRPEASSELRQMAYR